MNLSYNKLEKADQDCLRDLMLKQGRCDPSLKIVKKGKGLSSK